MDRHEAPKSLPWGCKMTAKVSVGMTLPFLVVSLAALSTYAQDVTPRPSPEFVQVGASKQGTTVTYQCAVTTKDAGVEKTIIRAASEDAAKLAATRKFGSRSVGLMGVSCTTGSATAPADSSARKEGVKTRAATPTPFDPIRPGVEFLADGSCRLSQQAIVAHPDARQSLSGGSLLQGSGVRMSGEVLRNAQVSARLTALGVLCTHSRT